MLLKRVFQINDVMVVGGLDIMTSAKLKSVKAKFTLRHHLPVNHPAVANLVKWVLLVANMANLIAVAPPSLLASQARQEQLCQPMPTYSPTRSKLSANAKSAKAIVLPVYKLDDLRVVAGNGFLTYRPITE